MDFQVYLPIAGLSVGILTMTLVGGGVGFLSGLFGVGGGFLITPLLMFLGIPIDVAIATGAAQAAATSASSALSHWQRGNVDLKMGAFLLAAGMAGSSLGLEGVRALKRLGHFEFTVSIAYVVLLGVVGAMMLTESVRAILRARGTAKLVAGGGGERRNRHTWLHGLPLKIRFPHSRLYMSVLPPIAIGLFIGLLSALMGVGGGFVAVPAMVYLLNMKTTLAVGTSAFQVLFVSSYTAMLQAVTQKSVDLLLAALLIVSGVVATQYGVRLGRKLNGEQLRALLAMLILGVCAKVALDLTVAPDDIYSLRVGR